MIHEKEPEKEHEREKDTEGEKDPEREKDPESEKDTENAKDTKKAKAGDSLDLEYQRYLNEIMDQLQNDDGFKKSIEKYKKNNNGSHPEVKSRLKLFVPHISLFPIVVPHISLFPVVG
jgi:hypothetical protein